jgi:hypothetical protein
VSIDQPLDGSQPASDAPTIAAKLIDGPLAGRSVDAEVVEGRPPSIIEVAADGAHSYRYCLAEWVQHGPSAEYTFLYLV